GLVFRRSAFKGELMFTSALVAVTEPEPPQAYFLQGHNEQRPDNENLRDLTGCHQLSLVLEEKHIAWSKLFLVGTNDVPANCQLLIVAGPSDSLLPSELDKIQNYLTQGGRLLALLPSLTRKTGLEKLLAYWGVEVGENVVFDRP